MMKRMGALALALLLLTLPAMALDIGDYISGYESDLEYEELELVESALNTYDSMMGKSGSFVGVVRNNTDKNIVTFAVEVTALDEGGNALGTGEAFGGIPRALKPGDTGVVLDNNLMLGSEVMEKLHSYTTVVKGYFPDDDTDSADAALLKGSAVFAEAETYGSSFTAEMTGQFTATVENTQAEPAFDVLVAVLLRDTSGKLLGGITSSSMDQGIPAGQSALFRMTMAPDMYKQLMAKGLDTSKPEVHCANQPF